MEDLWRLDAATIAEQVRAGDVSPSDVIEGVAAQMQKLEPIVHAFCTPALDRAFDDAARIEATIASGGDAGPLAGVPVAIKDLVCTKDIRTVSGSPAYADFLPEEDDIVVERLRAAGAIVIGKTNVPEFGYSGVGHNPVFETTRNPWNPELTSGGSSAGSAVAVATGMCPFAIGSDGGGSIRIPAAHSGVFGMKASMGRVPLYPGCRDERYPGVSSWESLEHIGPISRTVKDAALMLSIISGPDERDRHSLPGPEFEWLQAQDQADVTGLRIAYSEDWGYAAVDPQVREVVRRAVEVFERELGCVVEEAHPGWEDPYEAFWALVALDTDLRGMRRLVEEFGSEMSPHLVEFVMRPWSAEEFTDAVVTRKAVCNKMWRFMRRYDLLLTPTLAVPPFPLHMQGPEKIDGQMVAQFQWLAFTFPINMTGQPAASIPAGLTAEGLPVGLQIIGRHLDDTLVMRASAAFEAVSGLRDQWPPLVEELAASSP